jgi:hypothetical protein
LGEVIGAFKEVGELDIEEPGEMGFESAGLLFRVGHGRGLGALLSSEGFKMGYLASCDAIGAGEGVEELSFVV